MTMRLLYLYCGAGGGTRGYQDVGFHVTGVDNAEQPRYCGDDLIQADAFDYLAENLGRFDAIHASPPPDDVRRIKAWLDFYGKPYVIESTPQAPLRNATLLCGSMFKRELYRHRMFKTNFRVVAPPHPFHHRSAVNPSEWKPGLIMNVVGNCSPIEHAREIMGIDWMLRDELTQAIPPCYTAYVGDFLRRRLDGIARAA